MIRTWLKRRWLADLCEQVEAERIDRAAAEYAHERACGQHRRELADRDQRIAMLRATITDYGQTLVAERQAHQREQLRQIDAYRQLQDRLERLQGQLTHRADQLAALAEQLDAERERRGWLDHQQAVDDSAQAAEDRAADVDRDAEVTP